MINGIFENLSCEQKQKFEILTKLLAETGKSVNLTAIKDAEQIKSRHFLDSLAAFNILSDYASSINHTPFLIDIGSGAGFPVLPLAIALPDWNFVSVEATGKKADFQNNAIDAIGINNVEVICERAEELGRDFEYRQRFDVAITRAVGSLSLIAELAVPFLRKGGIFLTWKGPKVQEELKDGTKTLSILGMGEITQAPYNTNEGQNSDCRLVYAKKLKSTPAKFPREFKEIKKSPPR